MSQTETHPLPPFLPEGARLLMCGTFPPARQRWSMNFYYPNFINDMWRIFGIIYFDDKEHFVDKPNKTFHELEIREMLTKHHIALSDTGREIVRTRGNASDKYLDIRRHIDLAKILETLPDVIVVATTGEKAAGVIAEITDTPLPRAGEYEDCELRCGNILRQFRHWRMPSSSRAYPLRLDLKADAYRRMLEDTGLLE